MNEFFDFHLLIYTLPEILNDKQALLRVGYRIFQIFRIHIIYTMLYADRQAYRVLFSIIMMALPNLSSCCMHIMVFGLNPVASVYRGRT